VTDVVHGEGRNNLCRSHRRRKARRKVLRCRFCPTRRPQTMGVPVCVETCESCHDMYRYVYVYIYMYIHICTYHHVHMYSYICILYIYTYVYVYIEETNILWQVIANERRAHRRCSGTDRGTAARPAAARSALASQPSPGRGLEPLANGAPEAAVGAKSGGEEQTEVRCWYFCAATPSPTARSHL